MRTQSMNTDALHSGTLADVLDGLGQYGGFPSTIRGLNKAAGSKFLGKAYTVRWVPTRKSSNIKAPQTSTWDQVKNFLVPECKQSRELVYVAGTDTGSLVTELALAGGFSATDMQSRGFVALVLGGAIRDAHVVSDLTIPVWATGYIPADTQGSYRVAETGTWCNVGGQLVQSGDWVFGDETGIIKISASHIDSALAASKPVEDLEAQILGRVSRGEDLFEVVEAVGRL